MTNTKDIEYSTLLSKYNVATARNQMLMEKLQEKQTAWDEKETFCQVTEHLAKDLCNAILDKDRSRIMLGPSAVSDTNIHTLLREALNSYKDYCTQKTQDQLAALQYASHMETDRSLLMAALHQSLLKSGLSSEEAELQIAVLLQTQSNSKED